MTHVCAITQRRTTAQGRSQTMTIDDKTERFTTILQLKCHILCVIFLGVKDNKITFWVPSLSYIL